MFVPNLLSAYLFLVLKKEGAEGETSPGAGAWGARSSPEHRLMPGCSYKLALKNLLETS